MADHKFVILSPSFSDLLHTSVVQLEYLNKNYISPIYSSTPKFFADFEGIIESGHLTIRDSLEKFYDTIDQQYGDYSKNRKVYFVNYNMISNNIHQLLNSLIKLTNDNLSWSSLDTIDSNNEALSSFSQYFKEIIYKSQNQELYTVYLALANNSKGKQIIYAPIDDSVKSIKGITYWHRNINIQLNLLTTNEPLSDDKLNLCKVVKDSDGICVATKVCEVDKNNIVNIDSETQFFHDLKNALVKSKYRIIGESEPSTLNVLNELTLNLAEIKILDQIIDIKIVDDKEKMKIENIIKSILVK